MCGRDGRFESCLRNITFDRTGSFYLTKQRLIQIMSMQKKALPILPHMLILEVIML